MKKGVRFDDKPLESANSTPLIQEIPMVDPSQSILKQTDHVPRVDRQAVEAMNKREQIIILPESKDAFSGPIVERDPSATIPTTSQQQTTFNQKQSQFKVQRKK
jgi:hypothetical protein